MDIHSLLQTHSLQSICRKKKNGMNTKIITNAYCHFLSKISSSPLIITRMYVNEVQCYLTHQFVGEHYFPHFPESDIARTERILSTDFPINIVANSGVMHKIIFNFKDKSFTIGNSIEITVQTTNRMKTYKLYCPNKDNNFML